MVEFGDEFIIESYRIPWLIWIQLFVMILFLILLYFGFAVFDSDPSAVSSDAAAAVPPPKLDKPSSSNNPRRTNKEDRKLNMSAGTSGVSIRENETEDGESSMKESAFLKMFRSPNHPCNFLGQCKHAFLKCLGLDSNPESSRTVHVINKNNNIEFCRPRKES